MLALLLPVTYAVMLDLSGNPGSTAQLAEAVQRWQQSGQNIALLVGVPDGLADIVRWRANASWCLSNLTFPHPLMQVIIAEQIYRAVSLLANHPYHR